VGCRRAAAYIQNHALSRGVTGGQGSDRAYRRGLRKQQRCHLNTRGCGKIQLLLRIADCRLRIGRRPPISDCRPPFADRRPLQNDRCLPIVLVDRTRNRARNRASDFRRGSTRLSAERNSTQSISVEFPLHDLRRPAGRPHDPTISSGSRPWEEGGNRQSRLGAGAPWKSVLNGCRPTAVSPFRRFVPPRRGAAGYEGVTSSPSRTPGP
jgi:hypothetical protein